MVLLGKACSLNLAILEMACFPSSGAALAQLAAIVNPANKPTQIEMHLQAQIGRWAKNWLSYSVFEKKCLSAITVFFCKKRALPILFCHKSEPSKQYMSFRIIWKKFATIATLGTNQDSTLSPMYKTPHSRTTFGNWDVEKVHAVVARSTFRSQHVKHQGFGQFLEVEMSKKCTPLRREAHFEGKMWKTPGVRTTIGRSDVVSRGRRKGLCTLSKVSKNVQNVRVL